MASTLKKFYPLGLSHPSELNLDMTLNCGQAFRWKKNANGEWVGVVRDKLVYLQRDYFHLKHSLTELHESWCKADSKFKNSSGRFAGLRLLRQDPVEALFTFICSSNNNVQRITKMIASLCESYGDLVCEIDGEKHYAFPTVDALAVVKEDDLRIRGFGYRARYIVGAAKQVLDKGEGWLESLREAPRAHTQSELVSLLGVGKKVADCVALFSMDKLDIVPVDTHVWQIAQSYMPSLKSKRLNDTVYAQIGDFFREKFGDKCGWAHTLLFANELRHLKNESSDVPKITIKTEDISVKLDTDDVVLKSEVKEEQTTKRGKAKVSNSGTNKRRKTVTR